MTHRPLFLLCGLALASTAVADDCAHRAERNLDLEAAGIATLELRTGAGDLKVVGEPGLERIVVRGIACASKAEWLDGIRLVHRSSGDLLQLATEIPETEDGSSWFGSNYRRLELSIRVPARLVLDAQDSSGDVEIEGVAGLLIQDSSGDLEIERIAGDVRITDTSGDIEVSDVGGSVHVVSDSSGDIEIEDVASVTIDADSSGDIELKRIRGDAHVARDSSGDIEFEDVQGSASVGTDSSGSIRAVRIAGDFSVGADSGGGIEPGEVGGVVRLPGD